MQGDSISTVGDNISTVEVAQYSGDKDFKYYEFSKNLEIFSRAYFASKSDRPHHWTQLLTTADMVKDLGYKNLVLGKIRLWTYDKLGFWKYFVKFFGNCGRICEQFMIQGQLRSSAILRSIQHLLRMNSNLVGIQSESLMGAVRRWRYYSGMKKTFVIFLLHRLSGTKAWMLAVLRWHVYSIGQMQILYSTTFPELHK